MKKTISVIMMVIGSALFIVGLFTKIPNKKLSTWFYEEDTHSVVEEYVGGDAYNYIIGASLVGRRNCRRKAQKAIFISIGSLIFSLGLLALPLQEENADKTKKDNAAISMENIIE